MNIKYLVTTSIFYQTFTLYDSYGKLLPNIIIKKNMDHRNINNLLNKIVKHGLVYKTLPEFSFRELSYFLNKFDCLAYQVENKIDYLCFFDDILNITENFHEFVQSKINLFNDPDLLFFKLDTYSTGYIIPLNGAIKIVNNIKENGIIEDFDDQISKIGKFINLSIISDIPWKINDNRFNGEYIATRKFNPDLLYLFSKNLINNFPPENITDFLKLINIYNCAEGHIYNCPKKKELISELIIKYKPLKILQIGFNGGHSAELFLSLTDNHVTLDSIDIGTHDYVDFCNYYITKKYGNRHNLIYGDSKVELVNLINLHKVYDMILIDGNHHYETVKKDILNCHLLSHIETIIICNDVILNNNNYHAPWTHDPTKIWKELSENKVVETIENFDIEYGKGFVVGKYLYE